jgi:hypothetical protein
MLFLNVGEADPGSSIGHLRALRVPMLIFGVLTGLLLDKDLIIHVGQLRAVLVHRGQVVKLVGDSLQLELQAPTCE